MTRHLFIKGILEVSRPGQHIIDSQRTVDLAMATKIAKGSFKVRIYGRMRVI